MPPKLKKRSRSPKRRSARLQKKYTRPQFETPISYSELCRINPLLHYWSPESNQCYARTINPIRSPQISPQSRPPVRRLSKQKLDELEQLFTPVEYKPSRPIQRKGLSPEQIQFGSHLNTLLQQSPQKTKRSSTRQFKQQPRRQQRSMSPQIQYQTSPQSSLQSSPQTSPVYQQQRPMLSELEAQAIVDDPEELQRLFESWEDEDEDDF